MGGHNLITRVSVRDRGRQDSRRGSCDDRNRASSGSIASFERGEGEQELRNTAASGSWKRGSEFAPQASRKEFHFADTLILAQRHPFQTSDLQNCKRVHSCCKKPLSLVVCYSNSRKLILRQACIANLSHVQLPALGALELLHSWS